MPKGVYQISPVFKSRKRNNNLKKFLENVKKLALGNKFVGGFFVYKLSLILLLLSTSIVANQKQFEEM